MQWTAASKNITLKTNFALSENMYKAGSYEIFSEILTFVLWRDGYGTPSGIYHNSWQQP